MGIYKLMTFLQEKAPNAIKSMPISTYKGKVVACDASMAIYQFLVSTQGFTQKAGLRELTDKLGNKTGHLLGLIYRTIQFMENGIKPLWVFDGEAPILKNDELLRRRKLKEESQVKSNAFIESGDIAEAFKHKIRATFITEKNIEDSQRLIKLLGLPFIQAPCEAEAQCAYLVKQGIAYGTATEDMDALCFKSTYLLRGFNSKKEPIIEISYETILKDLDLTHEEFIDMCILFGCDYCDTITGLGPVTAYKLIKKYKKIENVLDYLQCESQDSSKKKKYSIPRDYNFIGARELLHNPIVANADALQINWEVYPNEDELIDLLVREKDFNETRVNNAIKKFKKSLEKNFV